MSDRQGHSCRGKHAAKAGSGVRVGDGEEPQAVVKGGPVLQGKDTCTPAQLPHSFQRACQEEVQAAQELRPTSQERG